MPPPLPPPSTGKHTPNVKMPKWARQLRYVTTPLAENGSIHFTSVSSKHKPKVQSHIFRLVLSRYQSLFSNPKAQLADCVYIRPVRCCLDLALVHISNARICLESKNGLLLVLSFQCGSVQSVDISLFSHGHMIIRGRNLPITCHGIGYSVSNARNDTDQEVFPYLITNSAVNFSMLTILIEFFLSRLLPFSSSPASFYILPASSQSISLSHTANF